MSTSESKRFVNLMMSERLKNGCKKNSNGDLTFTISLEAEKKWNEGN